jgi:hypothetical protein
MVSMVVQEFYKSIKLATLATSNHCQLAFRRLLFGLDDKASA